MRVGPHVLDVASVAGLAAVQDGGRPGRMHEGVPPGGALVPELLARANLAVGNGPTDAAIEVFGALTVAARAPVVVATDDGLARPLAPGEPWTVACGRARVRYLAVRGGLDVPLVLGGRGTLLVAGIGGHEGRPLRRGDALRVPAAPAFHVPPGAPAPAPAPAPTPAPAPAPTPAPT